MRRVLALLIAISVAGCSSQDSSGDHDRPAETIAASPPVIQEAEPTILELAFLFNGTLLPGAWTCNDALGCSATSPRAYSVDNSTPIPAGTLQGGSLTLTWNPELPTTQSLSLGAWLGCPECEPISLGDDRSGSSPLSFELPAGIQVANGTSLFLSVYNPTYHSSSAAAIGLSTQQDFQVIGNVVVRLEPTAGDAET